MLNLLIKPKKLSKNRNKEIMRIGSSGFITLSPVAVEELKITEGEAYLPAIDLDEKPSIRSIYLVSTNRDNPVACKIVPTKTKKFSGLAISLKHFMDTTPEIHPNHFYKLEHFSDGMNSGLVFRRVD